MSQNIEVQKQGKTIRILIADNHPVIRIGLRELFSLKCDITVAGEAAAEPDLLRILQQQSGFDLILLDPDLPDIVGYDLIARIRSLNTSLPILVFSMHHESLVVKRAFQVGASGFITKGCAQDTLITAIHKVASGERFVDPLLAKA